MTEEKKNLCQEFLSERFLSGGVSRVVELDSLPAQVQTTLLCFMAQWHLCSVWLLWGYLGCQ